MAEDEKTQNGTDRHPSNLLLFDSPRQSLTKHESLFNRFKHNQVELKQKFQEYIVSQKMRYPLTNKNFRTQYQEEESDEEEVDIRKIRKQKKHLLEELHLSMNESNYLHKKRQEKEKTFCLLKTRYKKVESIRLRKKEQLVKVQTSLQKYSEEIRKEKLRYKRSIEQSKQNIIKSRIQCQTIKHRKAEETRQQLSFNLGYLSSERQQDFMHKRQKCESVRESQKYTHLALSRVKQTKKIKADELKLQRLIREMAEREQIKLTTSRIKITNDREKSSIGLCTQDLESKIKGFRKSLGQRRLDPPLKIKFSINRKRQSRTQDLEEQQTKIGGFTDMADYRCYTEQL